MPARCVVFSGIRKHDGKSFRELLPGEYTQMSGRAGRRGLDSTGVVVIVSGDELPEVSFLTRRAKSSPLNLKQDGDPKSNDPWSAFEVTVSIQAHL
jgi:antiviral helicase SKI2